VLAVLRSHVGQDRVLYPDDPFDEYVPELWAQDSGAILMSEKPKLKPCSHCGINMTAYEMPDGSIAYWFHEPNGCWNDDESVANRGDDVTQWNRRADGWISVDGRLPLLLDRYVQDGPVSLNARGFRYKLLNRRVQVGWDEKEQSWGVCLKGLVSRKDRKINTINIVLSDEVMRSMVSTALRVFGDRGIYKAQERGE